MAVLGASSYTFVEATHSCRVAVLDRFTHPRLEFYGGVPEIAVPDNTKTGVKRLRRYEPELNLTYREMAEHYGLAVAPACSYPR